MLFLIFEPLDKFPQFQQSFGLRFEHNGQNGLNHLAATIMKSAENKRLILSFETQKL
jgi:hypothetical protein